MNGAIVQKTIRLAARDVDLAGRWRADELFLAMQEMGETHAAQLGVGRQALADKRLAWVLTRSLLEMRAYPVCGDDVLIKTWTTPARHALFPRYYAFERPDGTRLGCASTLWVLLDLARRAMVDPARAGILLPAPDDPPEAVALPGSLQPPDESLPPLRRMPGYSDFDLNGHVNNAVYVRWLLDALPIEQMRTHAFERLLVHYQAEILPGQAVELRHSATASEAAMSGIVRGKLAFAMHGSLRAFA